MKTFKFFLTSILIFSSVRSIIAMDNKSLILKPSYENCADLEKDLNVHKTRWSDIKALTLDVHKIAKKCTPQRPWDESDYVSQLPEFLTESNFLKLRELTVTTHSFNFEATLGIVIAKLPHLRVIKFIKQDPPFEKGWRRFQCGVESEKATHSAAMSAECPLPDNFDPKNLSELTEIHFVNYSHSRLAEKIKLFCSYYKAQFDSDLIFSIK